jgi:uncharacterized protein (DUF58 family)
VPRRIAYALLAVAVCAVFPVFVNDAVGYVPLGTCLFVLALSAVHLALSARALDCGQQVRYRECLRGEGDDVALTVRNASPFVLARVEPTFVVEGGPAGERREVRLRTALGPREERALRVGVGLDHVGSYEVGVARVEVFDLLGLFSRTVELDGRCRVRVLPNLYPLPGLPASEPVATDAPRGVRTVLSDDMDYAWSREYRLGDPMKTVHWKLSARTGGERLYTRLYEAHTNPATAVVVDFCADEKDPERRAALGDALVEASFSLLAHAHRRGVAATLTFCDARGAVRTVEKTDPDALDLLVDELPGVGARDGGRAAQLVAAACAGGEAPANLVLFACRLEPATVEALLRERSGRRGVRVVLAVPAGLPSDERRALLAPAERLAAAGVACATVEDGSDVAKGVLA